MEIIWEKKLLVLLRKTGPLDKYTRFTTFVYFTALLHVEDLFLFQFETGIL